MKPLFTGVLIASVVISSCKSHKLIPGFRIGMSEQELKGSIENKLLAGEFIKSRYSEDSARFIYNWKLLDTTIYTSVAFNQDGAPFGDLRILVMDLNDSATQRDIPEPYDIVEEQKSPDEQIFAGKIGSNATSISYSFCPEAKFKSGLAYLQSEFGKQDSITYQINKVAVDSFTVHTQKIINSYRDSLSAISNHEPLAEPFWSPDSTFTVEDTVYTKYHFHNGKSKIVLRRSKIFPPSQIISFSHISSVLVYQMSNSYESDLAAIIRKKKNGLAPSDIIVVPISYTLETQRNELGYQQPCLALIINISVTNRKTLLESREIKSMKGKIIIKDLYGEVLKTIEDIEYNTEGLKSNEPGLMYALGEWPLLSTNTEYNSTLWVNPKLDPKAFIDAIRNKERMAIEFVPDALMFSDGSVMK